MGQIATTPEKNDKIQEQIKDIKSLEGEIDLIATDFILKQNFKDLNDLMNKDTCDKLIVLTSEILANLFKDRDISYLEKRFDGAPQKTSENMHFVQKNKLGDILQSKDPEKIYQCIGIAKYYIQVAHLFAAITMSVNPQYTYKVAPSTVTVADQGVYQQFSGDNIIQTNAQYKTVTWDKKDQIPKGVEVKTSFNGLCQSRINVLSNGNENPMGNPFPDNDTSNVVINPSICETNFGNNLDEEPGIPELEALYLDVYDYSLGQFTEMSDNMKKKYQEDLKTFYTTFTGEQVVPDDITSFKKIPIVNYSKTVGCDKKNAQFDVDVNFKGSIVKRVNENIILFDDNGSGSGEILNEVTGFPKEDIELQVVKAKNIGQAGYKVTLFCIPAHDPIPSTDKEDEEDVEYIIITFVNESAGLYRNPISGNLGDKLFKDYATKLQDMINTTKKNKAKLLSILEQVFEKVPASDNSPSVVKINSDLTQSGLTSLIETTRGAIISMYLSCEKDFSDILKVFDAIIDRQILSEAESTQEQLKELSYSLIDENPAEELKQHDEDENTEAALTNLFDESEEVKEAHVVRKEKNAAVVLQSMVRGNQVRTKLKKQPASDQEPEDTAQNQLDIEKEMKLKEINELALKASFGNQTRKRTLDRAEE